VAAGVAVAGAVTAIATDNSTTSHH
jgi:hypothetical protein